MGRIALNRENSDGCLGMPVGGGIFISGKFVFISGGDCICCGHCSRKTNEGVIAMAA